MKNQFVRSLLAVALAAVPGALQAQPDAHYVPGIEGIMGASLPPPGIYFRDYNVFYIANQVNNAAGDNAGYHNFQALLYANVPRGIWITDAKFLGGYVGGDVVLPLIYQSLGVQTPKGMYNSSTAGIGDAYAEGTLSWHPGQFDIGAALGLWMPTGDSSLNPLSTRVGSGFWTPELTAGVTWYPDKAKTWSVSLLNRYEFNTEKSDSDITPGQAWTLEWGIGKCINKTIYCGVIGYYQQRITATTGDEPLARELYPYSRVAAVGPEIKVELPHAWSVECLYNYEFMADSRAQGNTVALTFTKKF